MLTVHDSFARAKRAFAPARPVTAETPVTMYVCGPTVYGHPHVGNARAAVNFDVLYRVLRRLYGADGVRYARNLTDVDDKIMARAAEEHPDLPPLDGAARVARTYAAAYQDQMRALGCLAPDLEPRATEHIPQMIDVIARLIAKGAAYAAQGHALFSVAALDSYGALSGRSRDELLAGARVDVAPYKRDAGDFVLWKPSSEDQPGWASPWGRGRPGWHLECTAMIEAELGLPVDIHGGGADLIFPHHENERAQGLCACEGEGAYARYWMHGGMLRFEGGKMSKSEGRIVLVKDLMAGEDGPLQGMAAPRRGEVIRLALLSGHYRQSLEWSDDLLEQSKARLDRWYRALKELDGVHEDPGGAPPAGVLSALYDDLNTPRALAAMDGAARDVLAGKIARPGEAKRGLKAAGGLLGVLALPWQSWVKNLAIRSLDARFDLTDPRDPHVHVETVRQTSSRSGADARIESLIAERKAAKAAKDFAKADKIRDDLAAEGVLLEDKPGGVTEWRRA